MSGLAWLRLGLIIALLALVVACGGSGSSSSGDSDEEAVTEPDEGTDPDEDSDPDEGTEPDEGADPDEGTEPGEGAEPDEGDESDGGGDAGTEPGDGTGSGDGSDDSGDDSSPGDDPAQPETQAEELLQEARDLLNADAEPITDEEFAETELAENLADPARGERKRRAHSLAMAAEDPDPEWFATVIEQEVIFTDAGERHTLAVNQLDPNGDTLGPVDPERMRIVVRIQRDDHDFDYIPREYNEALARWSSSGQLEIDVPADLERGRMVVAVRPDLDDPGQTALAERWSAAVSLEVWPTRSGVTVLSDDEVLFPDGTADDGVASDSKFSRAEIADEVQRELNNGQFLIPLVTADTSVSVDALVDYRLDGQPMGGRAERTVERDGQQLLLLAPTWFDVYDITDASDDFMVEQGLSPEFVPYREGPPVPGYDAQYRGDSSYLGPADRADISATPEEVEAEGLREQMSATDSEALDGTGPITQSAGAGNGLFSADCSGGAQVSFVFSPDISLSPADASVDFTASIDGGGQCYIDADPGGGDQGNRILSPAGGLPGILIRALLGGDLDIRPFGRFIVSLDGTGADNLSVSKSYSVRNGADFDLTFFEGGGDGVTGLLGTANVIEGAASLDGGVRASLFLTGQSGILGSILGRLGLDAPDVGVNAEAGIRGSLGLDGANAAAVYQDVAVSGGSITGELFGRIAPSDTLKVLGNHLGLQEFLEFRPTVSLPERPFPAEFGFDDVSDYGTGKAWIWGLAPGNAALRAIFGPSQRGAVSGRMGPDDSDSSVFEDPEREITYDLDECEAKGGEISAPVVACIGPMFCGETEPATFCGGDLDVSSVSASAAVGETARTSGSVSLGDAAADDDGASIPLSVSLSGSPLSPDPGNVSLTWGASESFEATHHCTSKGTIQGQITATSGELEDEASNQVNCRCSSDDPDCDKSWGSPHMITADGLGYDYYASGDYILSDVPDVDDIQVQARFLPGFDVSWPQAVALQVGPDVVEIQAFREAVRGPRWPESHLLVVRVNGEKVFPKHEWQPLVDDPHIVLRGGGSIFIDQFMKRTRGRETDPIAMTVTWPFDSPASGYAVSVQGIAYEQGEARQFEDTPPLIEIELTRPDTYAGDERGLLGTNDGDPSTDFTRRNGDVLDDATVSWTQLYALFGADWLVRPQECLFANGCIEPQFPAAAEVVPPAQREMAEAACQGLQGWYRETCIHDVGLSESPELVEQYYAETEDLNHMADRIRNPGVDVPLYSLDLGQRSSLPEAEAAAPAFAQSFTVELIETTADGDGDFMLTTRPPAGGSVRFTSSGERSLTETGDHDDTLEVLCGEPDEEWGEYAGLLPATGALQLWTIDPLSGNAGELLAEEALFCRDDNQQRMAIGSSHSVVTVNRRALAWGSNSSGQLGNDASGPWQQERVPVDVHHFTGDPLAMAFAGAAHTLAIDSGGEVWAWGDNAADQLGLGADAPDEVTLPRVVTLPGSASAIVGSTGDEHNLVIDDAHRLWAWGDNNHGQLGTGSGLPGSPNPMEVNLGVLDDVRPQDVAAGSDHSLLLDTEGRIWAWGSNASGQLGTGPAGGSEDTPVAIDLPVDEDPQFLAIAAGDQFSLALDQAGRIWSWGANEYGQLGEASLQDRPAPAPMDTLDTQQSAVTHIAAGADHALAQTAEGEILAWGRNHRGQLGDGGDIDSSAAIEVDLDALDGAEPVTIHSGSNSNLLIDEEDRLWAWGANGSGQLGDGSTADRAEPTLIGSIHAAPSAHVEITADELMKLDSGSDRQVQVGHVRIDETGLGTARVALATPGFQMPLHDPYLDVDHGDTGDARITVVPAEHCANVIDNPVLVGEEASTEVAVDDRSGNRVAAADFTYRCVPEVTADINVDAEGEAEIALTSGADDDTDLRFVAAGEVAVDGASTWEGKLSPGDTQILSTNVSCGPGSARSLGVLELFDAAGGLLDSREIHCLEPLLPAERIAMAWHAIALDPTGTASSWGKNDSGQVGDGSLQEHPTPVAVDYGGEAELASVSAGGGSSWAGHTLALDAEGGIWAWGTNWYGQLGLGHANALDPPVPQSVDLPADVTADSVVASDVHSLALDSEGRAWAWGANWYGQLGVGTDYNDRTEPTEVALWMLGHADPIAVAAGDYHSLLLDDHGRIWSWGANWSGQLGTGDESGNDETMPVRTGIPSGYGDVRFVAIAAGQSHSLAVDDSGSVWSWGANWSGQLGDGTNDERFAPAPVTALSELDTPVVEITAGQSHSLARTADGRVFAWGEGAQGQLGDGRWMESATPVEVDLAPLGDAEAVSLDAGVDSSLILDSQDRIWTWGSNASGQIGDGSGNDQPVPVLITSAGDQADIELATVENLRLAVGDEEPVEVAQLDILATLDTGVTATLDEDHLVFRGGADTIEAPVGSSVQTAIEVVPADLCSAFTGDEASTSISLVDGSGAPLAGRDVPYYCVPDVQHAVNEVGEQADIEVINHADEVVDLRFTAADDVLVNDGSAWEDAIGPGESGTLTTNASCTERPFLPLGTLEVLASDGEVIVSEDVACRTLADTTGRLALSAHVGFVDSSGEMYSWGRNSYGQHGDGEPFSYSDSSPVPVDVDYQGDAPLVAAAAGHNYSLALDAAGRVWSWGHNFHGQLGQGHYDYTRPSNAPPESVIPESTSLPDDLVVDDVAVGSRHSVALADDGSVWSWGRNTSGELGRGSHEDSHAEPGPVDLSRAVDAVAIAAGDSHTLALDEAGTLWAWGSNAHGELGNGQTGGTEVSPKAVQLPADEADTRFVAVAAGEAHSLALDRRGRVWSWGRRCNPSFLNCREGEYDVLGGGGEGDRPTPQPIGDVAGDGSPVVQIAAGGNHNVVRTQDGRLFAWGRNNRGQLGDGTREESAEPVEVELAGLGDAEIVMLVASGTLNAIVDDENRLWMWGHNTSHQFPRADLGSGLGGSAAESTPLLVGLVEGPHEVDLAADESVRLPAGSPDPIEVAKLSVSTTIAEGLAVDLEEAGFTWRDSSGPLELARADSTRATIDIVPAEFCPAGGAGEGETALTLIDEDGASLADATIAYRCVPEMGHVVDATGEHATIHLSSAADDALDVRVTAAEGVDVDGGDSWEGTLGAGDHVAVSTDAVCAHDAMASALASIDILAADGGVIDTREVMCPSHAGEAPRVGMHSHSLALDDAGGFFVWGSNHSGQLGDGTSDSRHSPVAMGYPGDAPLVAIEAGSAHTLSLDAEGVVWAWGRNRDGQIGTGSYSPNEVTEPEAVDFPSEVHIVEIAAGIRHNLALDERGQIWAWGDNRGGALGDGGDDGRATPERVDLSALGTATPVAITAGRSYSLVLDDQGAIWSWGSNARGRLGIGENSSGPGDDAGHTASRVVLPRGERDTRFVAVSAGDRHALALDQQGRVWMWGASDAGQLSHWQRDSRREQTIPAPIESLAGNDAEARQIVAGNDFSLVRMEDGRVLVWGSNLYGQHGSGESGDSGFQNKGVFEVDLSDLGEAEVAAVETGSQSTMLLDDADRIWAWGRNSEGQIGDGSTDDSTVPVLVGLLADGELDATLTLSVDDPFAVVPEDDEPVAVADVTLASDGFGIRSVGLSHPDLAFGDGSATMEVPGGDTVETTLELDHWAFCASGIADETLVLSVEDAGTGIALASEQLTIECEEGPQGVSVDIAAASTDPIQLREASDEPVMIATADVVNDTFVDRDLTIPESGFGFGGGESVMVPAGTSMTATILGDPSSVCAGAGEHTVPYALQDQDGGQVASSSALVDCLPDVRHGVAPEDDGAAVRLLSQSSEDVNVRFDAADSVSVELGSEWQGTVPADGEELLSTDAVCEDGSHARLGTLEILDGEGEVLDSRDVHCPGANSFSTQGDSSYGRDADGQWWAWGDNQDGQLGIGGTVAIPASTNPIPQSQEPSDPKIPEPMPIDTDLLAGAELVAVRAGQRHAVALDDHGRLWAWGSGSDGRLGADTAAWQQPYPIPVDLAALAGAAVVEFAVGRAHSLVLDDAGRLWGWGSDHSCQIGRGEEPDWGDRTVATPELVDLSPLGDARVVEIVGVGGDANFIRDDEDRLWSWGSDDHGQLGHGREQGDGSSCRPQPELVDVDPLAGAEIESLSAGGDHVLALDASGEVWGWGDGSSDQLGAGMTGWYNSSPQAVELAPVIAVDTVKAASGGDFSVLVDELGDVWTLGQNLEADDGGYGTLAMSASDAGPVAVDLSPIDEGAEVVRLQAGEQHVLVRDDQGRLWAWGPNPDGQLGDGTQVDSEVPVPVGDGIVEW